MLSGMKLIHLSTCYLLLLCCFSTLWSDTRIVLALRHAPESVIDQAVNQAKEQNILGAFNKFEQRPPSKLSRKLVKGQSSCFKPPLSGFMALYAGYITSSDANGILSFPLRHAAPKVYLAITNQIGLIKVQNNTISHKEYLPKQADVQLYLFEKKNDPQGASYWHITEESLPATNKINPLTVVLITKPKNIVVAPGDYMTTPGIQLVLPEIYVVGNNDIVDTTLKSLDYKYFFERITTQEKKVSDTVIQKISTNI